jgi:hypothetical protein
MQKVERFIEANFIGMELSGSPKVVKLTFTEPNGKRFSLIGSNLHRLLVSELRETNVVDRVNLWDATADPDDYRDALCDLVSGQDDPKNPDWSRLIETEIKLIRDGTKIFASIEAIYGAQILMLAENVVVAELL